MDKTQELRNEYIAVEVAYNNLDMIGEANAIADLCKIEADTLYPTKVRADRRRRTAVAEARKAQRAQAIGVKSNYLGKNKVAKAMSEVHMDKIAYAGNKGVADWDIDEAFNIFKHNEKVKKFYRLVDDWLAKSEHPDVIPNLKYMLVWEEEEVVGYDGVLDDDITEVRQYRKFFSNLSDAELDVAESFNEEWEPTWYKIATEYDDATMASLMARYEDIIPEPITHIYFDNDGTRWFIDASATVYRQKVGQMPKIFLCDYPDEPVKDDDFFFEPDECFPFNDDNDSDIRKTKNDHVEFPSILLDKIGL